MTTQDKTVIKQQGPKLPPLTLPLGDADIRTAVEWLEGIYGLEIDGQMGVRTGEQLPVNNSEVRRRAIKVYAYITGAPISLPDCGELAPYLDEIRKKFMAGDHATPTLSNSDNGAGG